MCVCVDEFAYVGVECRFDLANGPTLHQLPRRDGDTHGPRHTNTRTQEHTRTVAQIKRKGGTLQGHSSCLRGHKGPPYRPLLGLINESGVCSTCLPSAVQICAVLLHLLPVQTKEGG